MSAHSGSPPTAPEHPAPEPAPAPTAKRKRSASPTRRPPPPRSASPTRRPSRSASPTRRPPQAAAAPPPPAAAAARRVSFAAGPAEVAGKYGTGDGHPPHEGETARLRRRLGRAAALGGGLTAASIRALEAELGEGCRHSLTRLKRRAGLLPARAPPPHARRLAAARAAAGGDAGEAAGEAAAAAAAAAVDAAQRPVALGGLPSAAPAPAAGAAGRRLGSLHGDGGALRLGGLGPSPPALAAPRAP
jgi:hypothetical protein